MLQIDFTTIVKYAWMEYDPTREIKTISDISVRVSTNHVYKVVFTNGHYVFAKLSYFGKYEYFVEDHTIINVLSNNLTEPFENFLSRSLVRKNELFVHRFKSGMIDAWVVFYRPVRIDQMLPKRLSEAQIETLGQEFAMLHSVCSEVKNTLPKASKTLNTDILHLLEILETGEGKFIHRGHENFIKKQCALFFENTETLGFHQLEKIPVFVDWNIGNFSVTLDTKLFSRWDYDWFRVSARILDFYFLSRIVSDVGDQTVFSYTINVLSEDRFIRFLQAYHAVNPLTAKEIRLLPEIYRFFILKYVVKDGRYFFHEIYATKLLKEAYENYLPSIERGFHVDKLLTALDL